MSGSGEEMGVEEAWREYDVWRRANPRAGWSAPDSLAAEREKVERAIRASERAAVLAEVEEGIAPAPISRAKELYEYAAIEALDDVSAVIARIRNGGEAVESGRE